MISRDFEVVTNFFESKYCSPFFLVSIRGTITGLFYLSTFPMFACFSASLENVRTDFSFKVTHETTQARLQISTSGVSQQYVDSGSRNKM